MIGLNANWRLLMLFSKTCLKVRFISISLVVLLLQSCASPSDSSRVSKDKDQQLKQLGQDIIDMADQDRVALPEDATPETPQELALALNKAGSLSEQYALKQQFIHSNTPDEAKAIYRQAIERLKEKDYDQALTLFDQVIQLSPNLSGALVNKAIIAQEKGDIDLAKRYLQKALMVNELNPFALNMLGLIARENGEFITAERHYTKAIAIMPDYADTHLNYAILLELYRGRYREAHLQYEAYLALKPDDQLVKRWIAGLEIKMREQVDQQPLLERETVQTDKDGKAGDKNE